jgi:hypothetical protein
MKLIAQPDVVLIGLRETTERERHGSIRKHQLCTIADCGGDCTATIRMSSGRRSG